VENTGWKRWCVVWFINSEPVMLMRDASGMSKPMKVGHHTGIHRHRALMDDILFYGEENVLNESVSASTISKLSS
jgi:hypothetical protein